ncbi:MAG: cell division protein FtsX [Candidatus Eisenbacteria bacterium]|nr:permease-like cell division protein FtsX [Candidatus Eisenbacteria bacterium]
MSRLRFFFSEAWEIASRDRAGALASLTALVAVLFLLAVVLLAGHNIRTLAHALEARKGIEVFLSDRIGPERIEELGQTFRGFGEVSEVTFVSRDVALAEVEKDLGGVDVIGALGENPLSHAFRIRLTPQAARRPGVLEELAGEIGSYEGVDEVVYGAGFVQSLERGLRNVYFATAGAALLAGLAVLIVLWNTIKLAFLGRHETIRILKIVGATSAFIRFPYVLLGSLHAAFASAAALGLAALLRFAISQTMPGMLFFPPLWILLFLGGSILLGMGSSIASVGPALRHLERRSEALTSS